MIMHGPDAESPRVVDAWRSHAPAATNARAARAGMARIAVATAFSAGSGYLVMVIAAKNLGALSYAAFSVATGAVAAAAAGPALLARVFGSDYEVGAGVLAALTGGSCMIALLTLTGCAAIAGGRHRLFASGWWLATALSGLLLILPLQLETRVCIALIAGPLVGMCVHIIGLLRGVPA